MFVCVFVVFDIFDIFDILPFFISFFFFSNFGQTCDVKVSRLQLLGITCLHTAAKLEEIYPPRISDFALTTDGACTIEDIKKMEKIIGQVPCIHKMITRKI